MNLAVLPQAIAQDCQQNYDPQNEKCPLYITAWVAAGVLVEILDTSTVSAFATVVIAAFTASLFITNRWLWQSATRSADAAFAANAILQTGQRPWVKATVKGVAFARPIKGKIPFEAIINLTNLGKSPAFQVRCAVKIRDAYNRGIPRETAEEFYDRQLELSDVRGTALIPEEDFSFAQISAFIPAESQPEGGIRFNAEILMCVTYSSATNGDRHQYGVVQRLAFDDSIDKSEFLDRYEWIAFASPVSGNEHARVS